MPNFILFCIILKIVFCLSSESNEDKITLPDFPYLGSTFSGYLNILNSSKRLHYIFHESQRSASNDPLVLWLNGGPGCSSLLGWSQEHGPAYMDDEDTTFKLNPYSWNKQANMIYLESPVGTGYSYSSNPTDLISNDVISGKDNLEAIKQFFIKFPNYKSNDFYISGESYAGIYVPTLASMILDYNKIASPEKSIKLKGIIIGNGVTDWNVDADNAFYDFAFFHSIYSYETRLEYEKFCLNNPIEYKKCKKIKLEINNLSNGINIYDIYRDCNKPKNTNMSARSYSNKYTPWLFRDFNNIERFKKFKSSDDCTEALGRDNYMNRIDVKKAMKVNPDIKWLECAPVIHATYQPDYKKGSYYLYPMLIANKLKILIYSGDADAAVPINGTMKWINNLNLKVLKKWSGLKNSEGNIAGFTAVYDGLTFVSIKGGGHMVPQWKRQEAYYMFNQFISDKEI